MTGRPSWDEYFLGIATAVAARADCSRSRVGAVAVRDNRLIATGYNGTDPGSLLSCLAGHCPRVTEAPDPYTPYHNCIATHAEINCIQQAFKAYGGARFVLYVTREPCPECWRVLKVYCHTIYRVVWPGGEQ